MQGVALWKENLKGRNHVRACRLTDLRCVGMLEEISLGPPDGRRHRDCRLQDVIASLRAFTGMVNLHGIDLGIGHCYGCVHTLPSATFTALGDRTFMYGIGEAFPADSNKC